MTIRIDKIARETHGIYRVALSLTNGVAIGEFLFTIKTDDLEVVTWDDAFNTYMRHPPPKLSTLFEAIVAFHRAQKLELP